MAIKSKGFADYLKESPDLARKITYEEYMAGATVPQSTDISVEEAYAAYEKMVSELEGKDDSCI